MEFTEICGYRIAPGLLTEWTPEPVASPEPDPRPPSHLQEAHVRNRAGDSSPSWLAVGFDLPGPLEPAALGRAVERWIDQHETLRSGFRVSGEIERFTLSPGQIALRPREVGSFERSGPLVDHLRGFFDAAADLRAWPPCAVAAVARPESATVCLAFDHNNVDGYSLAIAVHEIQVLYRALSAGETPELPEIGSFVDHCAEPAPVPGPEDPAVHRWWSFLREGGGAVPSFPLDLGVPEGARAPQRSVTAQLLGAAAADRWENTCRRDRSAFARLLAAFGLALRRCGGPEQVRLLVPLHTRHEPRWTNAVGWFTTNAPVSFTASDGERTPLAAAEAFREALRTARTPLPSVLEAMPGEFRPRRQDVFMLSYLDYRGFPVSQEFPHCALQHVSSEGECDDAQFWITRTREGLFLRTRYPGTDRATAIMDRFQRHLTAALVELS